MRDWGGHTRNGGHMADTRSPDRGPCAVAGAAWGEQPRGSPPVPPRVSHGPARGTACPGLPSPARTGRCPRVSPRLFPVTSAPPRSRGPLLTGTHPAGTHPRTPHRTGPRLTCARGRSRGRRSELPHAGPGVGVGRDLPGPPRGGRAGAWVGAARPCPAGPPTSCHPSRVPPGPLPMWPPRVPPMSPPPRSLGSCPCPPPVSPFWTPPPLPGCHPALLAVPSLTYNLHTFAYTVPISRSRDARGSPRWAVTPESLRGL